MGVDYRDRHVVVTGGTGALGRAVVGGLIERGAVCHVPALSEKDTHGFPYRDHPQVKISADGDLADEAAVARLFGSVPQLWGSIHIAGGFAAAPVADTGKADLMQQVDMNFVTCFLCCAAAVRAMKNGGRIVNVAARPALEWRSGAGMAAYATSKAAVA